MGKHIPTLDQREKEQYITAHLFNELHWLLHAATEWSIQNQLRLEISGYNVQNYAMDSAFLHARCLFEFFVWGATSTHSGVNQFIGKVLPSKSYGVRKDKNTWHEPLHAYLMHVRDRSKPQQLQSPDGQKDLNQMPVYFANEILRLWRQFEVELGRNSKDLEKLARDKRKEAIDNAICVVNSKIARQHANEKALALKPIFVFA